MSLTSELRFGLRSWIRQPTLSLIALATLTLGIGSSTAIFTLVKAVLLDQSGHVGSTTIMRWGFTIDEGSRQYARLVVSLNE